MNLLCSNNLLWCGMLHAALLGEFSHAETSIAQQETLAPMSCVSLCGDGGSLITPELLVEYNWNPRVPGCSGMSCDSNTCSVMERKLPSYQEDPSSCMLHQKGLQAAGCDCSSGVSESRVTIFLLQMAIPLGIATEIAAALL